MAGKPKNHIQKPSANTKENNLTMVRQQYFGPLPPPAVLESFEHIYPGSAKIIVDNFVKQAEHRRSLESIVIRAGSRDSLLGVIFAFIMGMTLIIGAVICILNDKEVVGLSLGGLGLTSLVGSFIYGTNQNRKEREAKAKLMQQ